MSGYNKLVVFRFEVDGEGFEVTSYDDSRIEFEETRKNGQEDCHLSASAELVGGEWTFSGWDRSQLDGHMNDGTKLLGAFFKKHGPPTADTDQ